MSKQRSGGGRGLLVTQALVLGVFAAGLPAQTIQFEEAKLLASDGEAGDRFGGSVSLDGDTVIIGADGVDAAGSNSGAAYVYVRQALRWVEQVRLIPDDPETAAHFGWSVGLSGDVAVIGAIGDNELGSLAGAAYVFVRHGTRWTQQAKLLPDVGGFSEFGYGVAIDEDTIVVGAPFASPGGVIAAGEAYVFVRDGSTWTQQAVLVASDGSPLQSFGESVAISRDTIGIRAPSPEFGLYATYLFEREGGEWVEHEQQFPAGFPKLSGDTFAVGNLIYVRNGDAWDLQAEVMPSVGPSGAAALEGDVCVMSSCLFGVTLFTRSGTVWTEQTILKASDGLPSDHLACTAASISGETVVLGAPQHDALGSDSGAAYVFDLGVWTDLGGGRSGVAGPPALEMSGVLTPSSLVSLDLVDGAPSALAIIFISFTSTPASFLGGTLHAFPIDELVVFSTDGAGEIHGRALFPGAASGQGLWFQVGIQDLSVPIYGASLSNGVMGTVP